MGNHHAAVPSSHHAQGWGIWGCSPHSKEGTEVLECIQKKATELGKDLEHKERLSELGGGGAQHGEKEAQGKLLALQNSLTEGHS